MSSQRIFITGATGFVGRHLVSRLNERGASAEIFGSCFPERPESCADLCRVQPNVRLVHLDLRDADAVDKAVASIRPARIYHLAALSQVRLSWEKRAETFDTNLRGTFNLYESALRHTPRARILFVSSSDVYGFLTPLRRPCRERDRGGVVSPYAFTKVSGELLGEFYALRERLPIIAARPFPHTGPGQTADFVCSDWARQIALIEKYKAHDDAPASSAKPVIRVGNLALRRDYSDVRDVVHAYAMLMAKGKAGEVYNVCSGRAVSLEWILKKLLSYSRRKIAYAVDPTRIRKVDIPYLAGANGKLREATGWTPRVPLDQTLRDILDYWRARV